MKKISVKITVSFALLIVSLIAVLLFFFDGYLKGRHLHLIKQQMGEKARFVELVLHDELSSLTEKNYQRLHSRVTELAEIIRLRITVIGLKGKVITESHVSNPDEMDNHNYRIEIISARESGTGWATRYSSTLKSNLMYYAISSGSFVLRLSKPINEIEESIFESRSVIVFSGFILFICSLGLVVFISGKITGPVNESIKFAEIFSSGDFSRRIMNYANDEIGSLQKSLNALADTIEGKINSLIFEQNKLETTIETIDDGIAVIDSSNIINLSNSAFRRFLGISGNDKGRIYYEVIRNSSINEKIQETLSTFSPVNLKSRISRDAYCGINIKPIKDSSASKGVLIVLHDLSEPKRLEEMKTDLISNMSHEFKTPITILKGYIETIADNLDDRKLTESLLAKALVNIDRQTSLVADILKLNRLETSNEFNEGEADIGLIMSSCCEILSSKAAEKKISMMNNIRRNLICAGNSFLAEEIFFNILDNAINYNKEGGSIYIDELTGRGEYVIQIRDTGIGIPPELKDRIFERFFRVDKSRSRSTGGTGLGLSIVKHAADILGWKVSVRPGTDGTAFSVSIPL